jgi:A/G-specific adenine glycosylase
MMELSKRQKAEFLEILWKFYAQSGRGSLPWRQPEPDDSFDPYKIMVSELMLQQTQVARVIPKYQSFLEQFPDVQSLAMADLSDVLRVWQGLGYNRRAKFLWQAAGAIDVLGNFPTTYEELVKLPGIGSNTAGAFWPTPATSRLCLWRPTCARCIFTTFLQIALIFMTGKS